VKDDEADQAPADGGTVPLPTSSTIGTDGGVAVSNAHARAVEIVDIADKAARLGVSVDAEDAITGGVDPDALRAQVLEQAAAAAHAAQYVTASAPRAVRRAG